MIIRQSFRHLYFVTCLGALTAALAGCSPKDDARRAESTAAQEARNKGGLQARQLTVGLSSLGTAEHWLPWLEAGREGWLVLEPIYESLVAPDRVTGEFIPQLAESVEVTPDGKTWRFILRKGIQFHYGQGELTAQDVEYSYQMYTSDKAIASNKPILLSLVDRLEIVNPHELVFHLKVPDVTFVGRLANGQFGVASKKYIETVGEREAALKPVGTGSFRMVQHKRQESAYFEAVADHWRRTSEFSSLLLRRIPDQSARLAMLRSGEIDLTEVPYKLKREAEAAGLKFFRAQGAAIYHVQLGGQLLPSRDTFDASVPWVGDPADPASQERALKVRKALNLAVDRKAIIDAVFEGEGIPSIVPYLGPETKFVPAGMTSYQYDPKAARELLIEAGYPKGFSREIEMLIMPWPGRAEMADVGEVVAGFWERNLGLTVRRRPMDFGAYAQNVGGPRRTPWVTWAHGFTPRPVGEPITGMGTWLLTRSRYNSGIESLKVDKLADTIRGSADNASRVTAYHALAREFYDHFYTVPIASVPSLYAYNPKVIGAWPMQPGEAYVSGYEFATLAR